MFMVNGALCMSDIKISSTYINNTSTEVTESFFGTVVKSGKKDEGVYSTFSTNNAIFLEGVTNTTLALDALNIGTIRYPGGSESRIFDLSDPNDIAGLHRAIDYCAANNLALNFTLHDTRYFKNVATQEVYLTNLERAELSNFITEDLIGYANEKQVKIESIHLGNEFQSRVEEYGWPAWVGYAKVSSVLLNELDQILDNVQEKPYGEPDLVIQPNNWLSPQNHDAFVEILVSSIGKDGASAASKLDGIDIHGAGTGSPTTTNTLELTWEDYFGIGDSLPYERNLKRMVEDWRSDDRFSDLSFRNDAWAYATSPKLSDAALGMLQLHTASELGLTSVTSYVAYNLDDSALVRRIADQSSTDVKLTAGGALFAMMSDALKGTEASTFQSELAPAQESKLPVITRAFEGDQKTVLYLVNRTDQTMNIDINAADMLVSDETYVGGVSSVSVNILGSSNPTGGNGTPTNTIFALAPQQLIDGSDDFTLNKFEIAQVTLLANGAFGTDKSERMTALQTGAVLHGLGGNDSLTGSGFADTLVGGAGNDLLLGANGNDVLYGGKGADQLFGGAGVDTASYAYSSSALRIHLGLPSYSTADAAGDVYKGIEHIEGSRFNDTITGDSKANIIFGGAGNDVFYLSAGADTLFGGSGSNDSLYLGRSSGKVSLFQGAGNGRIVLDGIENLYGSMRNDNLTGNFANNILEGHGGDDVLSGFGGDDHLMGSAGRDKLFGGRGDDRLVGGAGADTMSGGLGRDQYVYNSVNEGGDTITDFQTDPDTADLIYVRGAQFGNLDIGKLNADQFVSHKSSSAATDAGDRFIYRESDSTLWFDMDGTGALPAHLLAQLDDSDDAQNAETAFAASNIWIF
jgi:Ca2+-binding RTX toxin-like protein